MFRLKIKFGRNWKTGLTSYSSMETAQSRVNELVATGQSRNKIKIVPETELFN